MRVFDERRRYTHQRLSELQEHLLSQLADDRERLLGSDTAIYVTGSGGRGEMSRYSDVDLFIARTSERASPVDSFQFHQAVARTFYAMGLPEPSGDGKFLKLHTAASLCGLMGKPIDDTENTLTARMLLLLESSSLDSTQAAYDALLDRVVATYWKNPEHGDDYQPLTLVNDIVRYWRTLILNYVAKNTEKEQSQASDESERRIRSYKLRFSRCMTCFSMLSYLLARTGTVLSVTKEHILGAVHMVPVERLQWVAKTDPGVASVVDDLLQLYSGFISATSVDKVQLKQQFGDEPFRRARSEDGERFGTKMFELLQRLGGTERGRYLFRYMVV